MTDHDHGLGLSGLRRIRQQHNPLRAPTLPSPASRTPSLGVLTRSSSLTTMLDPQSQTAPLSPGPSSPTFTEDLSRFPSESLHSFSFAHQSEDLLHNRQNVLKRSIEFMKDRMGWSATSSAGIASAQARVTGDLEMQHMLDLLAKAQLLGAGNLPNGDSTIPTGPLSGPAIVSRDNVFDKEFAPRTASPESMERTPLISPVTTALPPIENGVPEDENTPRGAIESNASARSQPIGESAERSDNSSRTPTNESRTTAETSPPMSRRPTALKRTMTDTAHVSVQQKLMDAMAKPFLATDATSSVKSTLSVVSQPFSPVLTSPAVPPAVHGHATRWVPAAQAIFTTEAKPPWTILAANDLACLLFGVTKAEVRKMGILEIVQEERRVWLERKLLKGSPEEAGDGSEGEISQPSPVTQAASSLLGSRAGGITAKLLSKPNSRSQTPKNGRRPATVHSGDPKPPRPGHLHSKSRGVLLCGDVVPIQVSRLLPACRADADVCC